MKKTSLILLSLCGFVLIGFASMFLKVTDHSLRHSRSMLSVYPADDYEKEWKSVESFLEKGLPKSALEVVLRIREMAETDQNGSQVIKATIYELRLRMQTEDPSPSLHKRLEEEIAKAKFPLKQVLHSYAGTAYSQYYAEDRWRIDQMTELSAGGENEDIRTWDAKRLLSAARNHFAASLAEPEDLRKINVEQYEALLSGDEAGRKYRPSLYDFLAWRCYEFLMQDEEGSILNANRFQIEGEYLLAKEVDFMEQQFKTEDPNSNLFAAIKLLQHMSTLHVGDESAEARVEVIRKRISLFRSKAIVKGDKNELAFKALEGFQQEFSKHPASTWFQYDLAKRYTDKADQETSQNHDEYNKALAIINQAIRDYPDSDGAILCTFLKEDILKKAQRFNLEETYSPNKPILGLMSYRNLDAVYYRVYPVVPELEDYWEKSKNDYLWTKWMTFSEPLFTGKIPLPSSSDHFHHSVEFALPGLPEGKYMLFTATSADFKETDTFVDYGMFQVNDWAIVQQNAPEGGANFLAVNRITGQPLPDTKIHVFRQYWDDSQYKEKLVSSLTTNKEGFAHLAPTEASSNYNLRAYLEINGRKWLKASNMSTYSRGYHQKEYSRRTHFFTDRAIYRPGQTIHFKGICMETDGKGANPRVMPNAPATVTFYDANHQEVSSLDLETNAFGSFSGSFTAPQGQLNGQMRIEDGYGSSYFRVEDYKRPKFEVEFEPVVGSFKLGEQVKLQGKAVAYAGSNITDAEVKYRVVRMASFPWWNFWCWGRFMPNSPEAEITNGSTKTDANGKFEIEFEAIPDHGIAKEDRPMFSYHVYADVVDITGETQSSSTNVQVGYVALNLSLGLPSEIKQGKADYFRIHSNNLNGQPEPSKGQVIVHRLESPKTVLINRLWNQPDQFNMSLAEFKKAFPNRIYKDEDQVETWPKAAKVLEVAYDSQKADSIQFKGMEKWETGQYVAEIKAKDKFGNEVKSIHYFLLNAAQLQNPAIPTALWTKASRPAYEPGEKAVIEIASSLPACMVLFELEHDGKIFRREWIKLDGKPHRIEQFIEEKHRGGIAYRILSIADGRIQSQSLMLNVPWSNKDLKIEYATFRDKLLPGAKETWTVKISGPKGEKMAAEMLAGMYDASLDAFAGHAWRLNPFINYYGRHPWMEGDGFGDIHSQQLESHLPARKYDSSPLGREVLNWFGLPVYNYYGGWAYSSMDIGDMDDREYDSFALEESEEGIYAFKNVEVSAIAYNSTTPAEFTSSGTTTAAPPPPAGGGEGRAQSRDKDALGAVKVRSNLNETAFFFPQLHTDEEGKIIFSFTMPEALTKWRFMTLAHTPDLKHGYKEANTVTQKDLMVMPNVPRFFREGDEVVYSAKIANVSGKTLEGQASLELFDALSMKSVDAEMGNSSALRSFKVEKGQNAVVTWKLKVPAGLQALTHRVKALAGNFSDGEESTIPVLTNSMLVTEALPLPLRRGQTKNFSFAKLRENQSSTLRQHKLTLEFSSNPAWYAVQALPYMMEYPYECAEQSFSRFYANAIASHVANKHPRIKQVFDQWKSSGKEALMSNLEKNQDLKTALLEETPWVIDAQDESQRKRNIALLFDLNRMADEMGRVKQKLIQLQSNNGGFPWFPGMKEDRYITQHIACGIGHLDRLGVKDIREDDAFWNMAKKAIRFLDNQLRQDYQYLVDHKVVLNDQHISSFQVQFLYARSFFEEIGVAESNKQAMTYYKGQASQYWTKFSPYFQGMIALALHRMEPNGKVPAAILKSLRENAIQNDEMGMYWKSSGGMYWYDAPIETHALLVEVFHEVAKDVKAVDEIKLWLLKQKQVQDWKTTKATSEACYALLLTGSDWLANTELPSIKLGGKQVDITGDPDVKVEAGTGYFKKSWQKSEIQPEMGNIEIKNNNAGPAWGAMYWQYFEQLDKISFAENKVSIQKQLFLQENTPTGPKLVPITNGRQLLQGDIVTVRILIDSDRNMEYVHLKDMRAAGFEPLDVLSGHRWQGNLGYYQSTRDAATNFFMDWLPKGKHVFEYRLRATHQGEFSNGITTIQCMYAPEFTSHSEGIRLKIAQK